MLRRILNDFGRINFPDKSNNIVQNRNSESLLSKIVYNLMYTIVSPKKMMKLDFGINLHDRFKQSQIGLH